MPHLSAEVLTGQAFADQQSSQITDNLSFFNTFLLVIGFVALFVSAFIIANTFAMLVGQRALMTDGMWDRMLASQFPRPGED